MEPDRTSSPLAVLKLIVALIVVSLPASSLLAQTTRLVDPLNPAYLDLQVLINAGLLTRFSLAQRGLSRLAFACALDRADRALRHRDSASAAGAATVTKSPWTELPRSAYYRELIQRLRERLELPDSLSGSDRLIPSFRPFADATVDVTTTDQPTRDVPRDNGLGEIHATLNSLLALRQGRPVVAGTTALLESNHSLETQRFAASVTPELVVSRGRGGDTHTAGRLQELQLRFLYRNLAMELGREYLVWGQGRDGGLLNSNNSPPLDLIKLSSEQPFYLPWLFHGFGPARLAIFYADLGADQNFPHAHLVGYRANIAPFSPLDLGVSVYTKSGGRGAPPATLTARLIDLLPFLDASAYNNVFGTRGHFEFSDHYAGFDGRLRIRPIGSSIYWDVLMNDFDVRRLKSVLWEDAGHVFGVDLPPLVPSGRLRASLEYHHTGIRYYEHQQFLSGQTVHQVLTGDPLGPDAQGAYAHLDWYKSAFIRAGLHFAVERRSNDQYAYIPEPNFGFRKTEERPKEWQARALTDVQLLPSVRQFGTSVQFGYQRTRNFAFVEGNGRNNFVARAAVSYRLQ